MKLYTLARTATKEQTAFQMEREEGKRRVKGARVFSLIEQAQLPRAPAVGGGEGPPSVTALGHNVWQVCSEGSVRGVKGTGPRQFP